MGRTLRELSIVFSAGVLGGLANSVTVWIFGVLGVTQSVGVDMAPPLTLSWLYPRLVWGGIWGFLFLIPLFRGKTALRGFVFSLAPTIVQLYWVFPYQLDKGMMGLDLGAFTPIFVIFFNFIWGLVAALWVKAAK